MRTPKNTKFNREGCPKKVKEKGGGLRLQNSEIEIEKIVV